MKYDMHCHTKEGSIDAKVRIEDYINRLMKLGFDGMLVTDHNSYKGYEEWNEKLKGRLQHDFTVLKGIEYDTRDAGHFLAILPEGIHSKLLSVRGMTAAQLEKIVHELGGILGPAHPYGTGYFALMNTKTGKKNEKIINRFDFIETFNACAKPLANLKAKLLAEKYHKPSLAGSDAHREQVIGTAFTEFEEKIKNNDDLIRLIKRKEELIADGSLIAKVEKGKNRMIEKIGVIGYYIYNHLGALVFMPKRMRAIAKYKKEKYAKMAKMEEHTAKEEMRE